MKRINFSKEIKKSLQSLLDKHKTYDLFCKHKHSYEYAEKLNELITYCAYCNIENIETIKYPDGKKFRRMEFDHFIAKNGKKKVDLNCKNLIPSCHDCNHAKSNKDSKDIINPLEEDFDSIASFRLDIVPNALEDYTKANIMINITTKDEILAQKAKNSIDLFNLEIRYNKIKTEFKEFYMNINSYPDIRKRDIQNIVPAEKNIIDYIFDLKNNDINHTKCGKFKKDIIKRYVVGND